MPKPLFEIKVKTGWKKLDDLLETVQNAINERTPLAGFDIDIDDREDGMMIDFNADKGDGSGETGSSGGGSGATVAMYGARDGAPAVFHLLQASPPTTP